MPGPDFFPEGGEPKPMDSETRSLQKIVGLLYDAVSGGDPLDVDPKVLGGSTVKVVDDATAATSLSAFAIYCVTETVVASLTATGWTDASKLVGKTLPAGAVLSGGTITAVTLTSGCITIHS